MDCVFCQIVNGEIPSFTVAEQDDCLAFLDIKPVKPGHTLVIPKDHYRDLLDLPPSQAAELIKFSQKVAKAVKQATNSAGFNITLNNGAAAGQIINHAHFHIIPRFDKDNLSLWPQHDYSENQAADIAGQISNIFKQF